MNNITPGQVVLLEQLRTVDPNIRVRWNEARGVAASIRGRLTNVSNTGLHDFLDIYGELFGLSNSIRSLILLREQWTVCIAYFESCPCRQQFYVSLA